VIDEFAFAVKSIYIADILHLTLLKLIALTCAGDCSEAGYDVQDNNVRLQNIKKVLASTRSSDYVLLVLCGDTESTEVSLLNISEYSNFLGISEQL